jgi:hypothetical protein
MAIAASTKYIGIVIHANALLFSNGITQNAYFLYQCLSHIGYKCRFLCNEANPPPFGHDKIPLYQVSTNSLVFDPTMYGLIITVTRQITCEQYSMFHTLGIRVISLICGNHFMQDQEDFVRGARGGSFFGKADTFDEIWTLPSYKQFTVYMETLMKVPVYVTPHLWHPCILEKRAAHLSKVVVEELMYDVTKHTDSKIDIVIMEPNLALFKNAWLPIIASECLHIKYPDMINNVIVFNFPERPDAYSMVQTLSLGSKLRPFTRQEMDQILVYFANRKTVPIFLSHQTCNALNYLYYELIYFGYPLVHNSDMLDGCGYYYKDNDIDACVESILTAFKHHNKHLLRYKADGLTYLERVNPLNADVCRMWNEKVKAVL